MKRLEERKKKHIHNIRKRINKTPAKQTKRLGRKKKKTNFKTLKPSLLELKIKKKNQTNQNPLCPIQKFAQWGIEKKVHLNPRGPGFDPLPRKKPI